MRCPCCGTAGVERMTLLEGLAAQFWKVVGIVAFLSASVVGQSHLIGEPWEHYLAVGGAIAGALIAWNLKQHPVKKDVEPT